MFGNTSIRERIDVVDSREKVKSMGNQNAGLFWRGVEQDVFEDGRANMGIESGKGILDTRAVTFDIEGCESGKNVHQKS